MKFAVIRVIEWSSPSTGLMEGNDPVSSIRDIEIVDLPDAATANRLKDDMVKKYDRLQGQFHEYMAYCEEAHGSGTGDIDFSISIYVDPVVEYNTLCDSDSAISEYSGRLISKVSNDIWPAPPTRSIIMRDFGVKPWIEGYFGLDEEIYNSCFLNTEKE